MNPAIIAALIQAATAVGGHFLSGSDDSLQNRSIQTKQQKKFQNSLLDQAQGMLGQGGGYQNAMGLLQQLLDPNSQSYQDFEKPYLNEFNEQTLPRLAEQFAGAGALSSSGFGQALGGAASGYASQLTGLKQGMRQNALQQILGQFNQLTSTGLVNPQFNTFQKDNSNPFAAMIPEVGKSLQNYFSQYKGDQQANAASPYQTQYPLTNYYDQTFRAEGLR